MVDTGNCVHPAFRGLFQRTLEKPCFDSMDELGSCWKKKVYMRVHIRIRAACANGIGMFCVTRSYGEVFEIQVRASSMQVLPAGLVTIETSSSSLKGLHRFVTCSYLELLLPQ